MAEFGPDHPFGPIVLGQDRIYAQSERLRHLLVFLYVLVGLVYVFDHQFNRLHAGFGGRQPPARADGFPALEPLQEHQASCQDRRGDRRSDWEVLKVEAA